MSTQTEERLEATQVQENKIEEKKGDDYYYGHVEPRYPKEYETTISLIILVGTLLLMGVMLIQSGIFS